MATQTTTNQVASYKGKKYRLLWSGSTKYGQRAKLGFWDGSKEFWVDLALVTISQDEPLRGSRGGHVCAECGRSGRLVADLEDGLMKHWACCDIPPG